MKRLLTISVLGIFLLPVLAFANPPMEAAKNKKTMREIGLNDQQIEKLQELRFKADRERIDIRSELEKAHLDMQQLLSVDKPNEAAVFTQIEKIGALDIRLKKNLFGSMLEARKLMTPEQWEKIEKLWAEGHGKDRRMHGECGCGMQPDEGPEMKAGPAPKTGHFPGRHGDGAQPPAGPATPTPATPKIN